MNNGGRAGRVRRTLLVLGAIGLGTPRVLFGQGKVHRIAFLGTGVESAATAPLAALRAGLRDLGYVESRNITIDYRYGEDDADRLQRATAELVRSKPEVIVVWGTPAGLALKKATSTIPIVMVNIGDPEETGLVASLARPGGNVTGLANLGGSVTAKQLELLKQILPGATRIAVLRNPRNPSLVPQLKGAEAAARPLGLQLTVFDVQTAGEFDAAFAAIASGGMSCVLVLAEPLFFSERQRIAQLASKHRMPTVSARSELADAGLMMTYGASAIDQYNRGAVYVDKILRGAKPADLPVQQASKFELVFNLKTAKAIGVTVPTDLLVRADRVIQ